MVMEHYVLMCKHTHQNKHHCGSPGKKPTSIPLHTLSASLSLMCSSVKGGAHTSYNRSEESTCSSLGGSSVVRHCFKIHNGITLNIYLKLPHMLKDIYKNGWLE